MPKVLLRGQKSPQPLTGNDLKVDHPSEGTSKKCIISLRKISILNGNHKGWQTFEKKYEKNIQFYRVESKLKYPVVNSLSNLNANLKVN